MKCTVFGGKGFVGEKLTDYLCSQGYDVSVPDREADIFGRSLGHIFYCIGLTADFRSRPFHTVDAHVTVLSRLLEQADFDSFLYLSSTRIYANSVSTREDSPLMVNPSDPSDLYNISKLMGESLCLACGRERIQIARLSNVVGNGMGAANFLGMLIHEAINGKVVLQTNPESAKDYVLLDDVVQILAKIAFEGREQIYNVASGQQVANYQLLEVLRQRTGCDIECKVDSPLLGFPPIDITRVQKAFNFSPRPILAALPQLIEEHRKV